MRRIESEAPPPFRLSSSALLLLAAFSTAFVGLIAFGYFNEGAMVEYCTWDALDAHHDVVSDPTSQGLAHGYRDGQVLDLSSPALSIADYVAYNWTAPPGTHFNAPVKLGKISTFVPVDFIAVPTYRRITQAVDVIVRLVMITFGLLLLWKGRDLRALTGGSFLSAHGLSEGYNVSFSGLPTAVQVTLLAAFWILDIISSIALIAFSMTLLPRTFSEMASRAIAGVGVLLIALNAVPDLFLLALPFTRTWPLLLTWSDSTTIFLTAFAVMIIVISTVHVEPEKKTAMQILALSSLLGFGLVEFNDVWGLFHHLEDNAPFFGIFDLGLIIVVAGWAYAILFKRLLPIDFFVTRAIAYGSVGLLILGTFVTMRSVITRLALGSHASFFLNLIVPLALGISLKWTEAKVRSYIESLIYRQKIAAIRDIELLADDLRCIGDIEGSTYRLAIDLKRAFNLSGVTIYRKSTYQYETIAGTEESDFTQNHLDSDDPILVRLRAKPKPIDSDTLDSKLPPNGVVFPLTAAGVALGIVFCGYRNKHERFEPDELSAIENLVREFSIAMILKSNRTTFVQQP